MKIEWNENGFSASMNNEQSSMLQKEAPTGVTILRENKTLMVGMIAFICAIVNLLFGLFLNLSTDLLAYFAEHTATHWMVVLLMFSVVLFSFAVLSGIFSIMVEEIRGVILDKEVIEF